METNEIKTAQDLIHNIRLNVDRPIRLMEFCGGHTVAILKNGIRQLLPSEVQMSSGPDAQYVTAASDIDKIILISLPGRNPGVLRPGEGARSVSSLQQVRAEEVI
jgi:hydrogenase expression/formation protein HypD